VPARPAAGGSHAGFKKVPMSTIRRALTPVLLLCGMLLLSFTLSSGQSRVKSSHSQRMFPQSLALRLKHSVPAKARDAGAKVRGRSRVTAKDTQTPTQTPQFSDVTLYPNSTNFGAALTGDFNGDGKPDLLMGTNILLGNGDGTFQAPSMQVVYSAFYESVATGDFNNDGKLDLAVAVPPGVTIQLGNGDGTFRVSVSYTLGGK
jgi:FG-GAP-like repeat